MEGARVIAIARRRVFRIEALAGQIREQTGEDRVFPITTDMADREQAATVVREIAEKYGRVDAFVHAVNRALRLGALEVSDHEFDLTMQINVKSALYGVQAVAPLLKKQARRHRHYNPTPVRPQILSLPKPCIPPPPMLSRRSRQAGCASWTAPASVSAKSPRPRKAMW